MNKSLPAAAIIAAVAVCAVLVVVVMLKISSSEPPAKSGNASPYTKVGQVPPTPGSGINSLTGEPLSDNAKDYELQSQQAHLGKFTPSHP